MRQEPDDGRVLPPRLPGDLAPLERLGWRRHVPVLGGRVWNWGYPGNPQHPEGSREEGMGVGHPQGGPESLLGSLPSSLPGSLINPFPHPFLHSLPSSPPSSLSRFSRRVAFLDFYDFSLFPECWRSWRGWELKKTKQNRGKQEKWKSEQLEWNICRVKGAAPGRKRTQNSGCGFCREGQKPLKIWELIKAKIIHGKAEV